jgi:hypothetical protein
VIGDDLYTGLGKASKKKNEKKIFFENSQL